MLPNPAEDIARRLGGLDKRLQHLERLESPSSELSIPLFAWASPPALYATTKIESDGVLAWNFTNGTTEVIDTTVPYFPKMSASSLVLRVYIEPSNANNLNAYLLAQAQIIRSGTRIIDIAFVNDGRLVAMPGIAKQILYEDFDLSGLLLLPDDMISLRLVRFGADVTDTFTGDAYIRGTRLLS